jgi:excisionase family DNA binding protein
MVTMTAQRNPLVASGAHVASFSGTVTRRKTRATVTAGSESVQLNARGAKLLAELLVATPENVAAVEQLLEALHPSTDSAPTMISPGDAAALLGVSRPTVVRWANEGLLTDHQVGSHHRFDRDEVLSLAEQRRAQAASRRTEATRERARLTDQGVDLEAAPTPAELVAAGQAARAGDSTALTELRARQRRVDARRAAQAAGEPAAS